MLGRMTPIDARGTSPATTIRRAERNAAPPRASWAKAGLALQAVLVILGVAACGVGVHRSATPLVHRLETAPVLAGAVRISEHHADATFEVGPSAELEYSLAQSPPAACPELLRRYLGARYTLAEFAEGYAAITDPESWCAKQAGTRKPGEIATVVLTVYPPGVSTHHPADGFAAVVTAPRRVTSIAREATCACQRPDLFGPR